MLINLKIHLNHSLRKTIYLFVILLSGCATYKYESKPIETKQLQINYEKRNLDDQKLGQYLSSYGVSTQNWPLQSWNLQSLALAAYYFHPDLKIAIAEYDKARLMQKFAGQYPNPEIELPLEHHSDTSGGISPWTAGLSFNFVIERKGKRDARKQLSLAETDLARSNVNNVAWDIYKNLRQRYIGLYIAQKTLDLLKQQIKVAGEIISILSSRQQNQQTSEFEVSSARLDLQKLKLAEINQQVLVTAAHHAIADAIGVPSAAIDNVNFDYSDIEKLNNRKSLDESDYRAIALQHRPEIQAALSNYAVYEANLRLQIESQYPDINLSPGFIFDQQDKVWTLGASWLLALFHPENEGPIQEALADRETRRKEFLAQQEHVINDVSANYARLEALAKARKISTGLYDDANQRYTQLKKQYDLGYIDNLELTRSKNEVIAMKQAVFDMEASYLNTSSMLEDAIGFPLLDNRMYQFDDHPNNNK